MNRVCAANRPGDAKVTAGPHPNLSLPVTPGQPTGGVSPGVGRNVAAHLQLPPNLVPKPRLNRGRLALAGNCWRSLHPSHSESRFPSALPRPLPAEPEPLPKGPFQLFRGFPLPAPSSPSPLWRELGHPSSLICQTPRRPAWRRRGQGRCCPPTTTISQRKPLFLHPQIVGNVIKPSKPLYISPVNYKTQVKVL